MSLEGYAPLERRLGHTFADVGRLERALTHRSYVNENPGPDRADNERMEFLGDAVVGLAVAHLLMEAQAGKGEGELTKMRARIVNEAGLADVASSLALGEWLFLGRGEEQSGGRHKPSVLADACEAVLAAVYLDAGFDAALRVVRSLFAERLAAAVASGATDGKTRLQERAQALLRQQPRYAVVGSVGPEHDKVFEVAVYLQQRELGRGLGRSKREAEQRAADAALATLDAPPVVADGDAARDPRSQAPNGEGTPPSMTGGRDP